MNKMLSEFLFVSEFGCKESVLIDDKKAIRVCADRAYRDLCRTLRYKKPKKKYEKKKSELIDKSIDMIIEGCENLYKKNIKEEYDDTHQKLCEKLRDMVNEADILDSDHKFSYGQAQKWVNMTMKYFVLMKNEGSNDRLLSIMHIPVDNYVKDAFKKSFPQDMEKEYDEPWSKWDEDTYLSFINNLRELVEAKKLIMIHALNGNIISGIIRKINQSNLILVANWQYSSTYVISGDYRLTPKVVSVYMN